MPGDNALTATSTSCLMENSRSAELTRSPPMAVQSRMAFVGTFDFRHHHCDRCTRKNIVARAKPAGAGRCRAPLPNRQGPARRDAANTHDGRRIRSQPRSKFGPFGGSGSGVSSIRRRIALRTSSLTNSMTVSTLDAAGHVPDEEDQRSDTDEGQQDADAERKVRHELAFVARAHTAKNHQGVRERSQKKRRA